MRMQSSVASLLLGLFCSVLLSGVFAHVVFADTTSTDITVTVTVSSTGGSSAVCGDGVTEGAEECDEGGSNGACPASCSASCTTNTCGVCGDGVVDLGESCDDGASNGSCPANCSASCTTNACGGDSGNDSPVITVLSELESIPTTTITWEASDPDGSITSCAFSYGTSILYGNTATVVELGAGQYTSDVAPLEPLTVYFYNIACTDNSAYTTDEAGSFTTPAEPFVDTEAPVITDIVSSTTETTGSVSWIATDNVGVTSCAFQYTIDDADPYGESEVVTGAYEVFVENLLPNTTYPCRLGCWDAANNFGYDFCTLVTAADDTPPPPVENFTATALSDNTIQLTWDYTDSLSDFFSYRIHYSTTPPPPFIEEPASFLTVIRDINTTEYTHTTPIPGVRYYYSIGVRDTSVNWSELRSASAVVTSTASVCGNNIQEGLEECDDGNANNNDACTNSCTVAICGDQIVQDAVEQCDIDNLNNTTCVDLGFDSGVLACNTKICGFDTSGCVTAPLTCGDGIVDPGEECDDANKDNTDACTNVCENARCGDGVIWAGQEQCEAGQLAGQSCSTLGYQTGMLSCSGACVFDTSQCDAGTGGPSTETICDDGIDNDSDGFIDCSDVDCAGTSACYDGGPTTVERICNDGIDNDSDGAIDCEDSDCAGETACQVTEPACNDGLDNDGDGFIDLLDEGCEDPTDDNEYNSPGVTVDPQDQLNVSDILFLLAERTIVAEPIDQTVTSLVDDQLTVVVDSTDLAGPANRIDLLLANQGYPLSQGGDGRYYADVIMPAVGAYDAAIEIRYASGLVDVVRFTVESKPYGRVTTDSSLSIDGAAVTLYRVEGEEVTWPASIYRQVNPILVDSNGAYGFVVPNGTYRLVVQKQGFRDRKTFTFAVRDYVVNDSITLLALPETIAETISFVAEVVQERAVDVVVKIDELADDPLVEQVTQTAVVPAAAGASLVFVIPSLWSILFPLLRFLFLQPLLLLGRRKREAWGVVYNSLTKLPVDLAVVRLLDAKTGKIVQSRVTDKSGRYLFMVEPGTYKIEVTKQQFVFPSALLSSVKTDGDKLDIYHGEELVVTEDATALIPNIPLDPVTSSATTVRRIQYEKFARLVQHAVSIIGVVVTAISLYITPTLLVGGFLVLHILLYGMFLRYVKPKKAKGWGIVYDGETRAPVGKVVARLFTKEYNKLVATQVTDSKGRYSFLVGPNKYYVSFEKEGYDLARTDDIDYSDKQEEVVKENVRLKKKNHKDVDKA